MTCESGELDRSGYERAFGINPANPALRRRALQNAHDIRKFEIEMYWKRATYFWTFIAAALAAYGAIQLGQNVTARAHLSVVVGTLGFVFSFSWWCVYRGNKNWQENWEDHVDLLEDQTTGPLYKTVLTRTPAKGYAERLKKSLAGSAGFSVTKVNEIVSLFVSAIWLSLIATALAGPFAVPLRPDYFVIAILVLGFVACVLILAFARTQNTDKRLIVTKRKSEVAKDLPYTRDEHSNPD